MPKSAQRHMFSDVLGDVEQDVGASLETGTFEKRPDWVVGHDPRVLDGQAREDADELATEFFERYEQLEVDSDRRRQKGEGEGASIPTTAVMLVFGSAEARA